MTRRDALRALVDDSSASAMLTIPRAWLVELLAECPAPPLESEPEPETQLTAEQVAELLNVATRWVYDHSTELGARHLSRRCVRFSRRAVERYLSRRTATQRAS